MSRTIGVFGGSFNPPHIGHLMAVTYALSVGDFDLVLVVPTFQHAFEKQLVDFKHRAEMTRLAINPLIHAHMLDIEQHISTPSYMVNTLNHLRCGYYVDHHLAPLIDLKPEDQLRLILGNDCSAEKDKWHKWDEIEEIAPPYVLPRKDERLFPAVSSTLIRERLGHVTGLHEVSGLVPAAVLGYIERHGLYVG